MLLALLPLLQAVIGGASLEGAAAALTASQWINIGAAVLEETPDVVQAVSGLHGLLASVVSSVLNSGSAAIAAQAAQEWLKANAETAMRLQPGISTER